MVLSGSLLCTVLSVLSLILLTSGEEVVVKKSDVVVLDTENFEHDTQITTGATTGDWFVEFYAPWCGHCKKLESIWEEVAVDLKDKVNVAKVDVTANAALGKRFAIKGFPTIKFFAKGVMYSYPAGKEWPRNREKLVEFASGGYVDAGDGVPAPEIPNFVDEVKAAMKKLAHGVLYYVKHPQKIKENEWGFMFAGFFMGSVIAGAMLMIWTMLFAGERLPLPEKKTN